MITAVDTNILLDVFAADASFGPLSASALRSSLQVGSLVACEVVWAEVRPWFRSEEGAIAAMQQLGVRFEAMDLPAALLAGAACRRYRQVRAERQRVIADFLIGAHAQRAADRLLTRDRGFYRRYFPELRTLDPSEAPEGG